MTAQPGIEFFVRFINEKHNALVSASNDLVSIFAGEDRAAKEAIAQRMSTTAKDLRSAMAEVDVPEWLTELSKILSYYNQGWDSAQFFSRFILLKQQIDRHVWSFNATSAGADAFDFDSLFERYKAESRLPELFEEIVRILEEIQASGALDSVTLLRALSKVISTVKKSKDGSYFSINSAWEFLSSFLSNYFWGELEKVPMLGGAFAALRKTIEETNEEMFKVHSSVVDEMNRMVQTEIKPLQGKPTFKALSYEKDGQLAEMQATRLLPDVAV